VLGRIFECKREKGTEGEENYVMRSSITCAFHQILVKTRRMKLKASSPQEGGEGEMKNAYKFLVGKSEGMRTFWKYRRT
jgi:hypothetical protein